MSDEDAAALFPGEEPVDLARRLATDHGIVAITLGGEGAVIATADALVDGPARRRPRRRHDRRGRLVHGRDAGVVRDLRLAWPPASSTRPSCTDLAMYAASAAAITCSRPGADPPHTSDLTP